MSSVLNLVIFAILWQKTLSQPLESMTTTVATVTKILKSLNQSDQVLEEMSQESSSKIDIQTTTVATIVKFSENLEQMGRNLEEVPQGSPQIKILNLAYNDISTLPEFIFNNKSYKSLTKIELNQNKISSIHLTAFKGLRQLTTVVLSHNNITTLDAYIFRNNPKLEKLDLSRNNIIFNRLRVFLVSQSMQTLIVSHNRIEQIYELTFMGLPNLKNLILEGNNLNTIAPNSFKSLNKLQYLSLANTGVYHLSESMFNNNLPRIIDLQETPFAKKIEPPLRTITNDAFRNLITFDSYVFETSVNA